MSHTPGPWVTDRNHIITDKGDEIATASYQQSGYVQANIRLIAAAPDLLEAARARRAIAERLAEKVTP